MAERERTSLESLALFLSLGERLKIDGKVSPHGAYVKNAKIGDMDVSVAYWPADESGGALLQTQSFKASTSRLGVHVEETRKTTLEYIGSDFRADMAKMAADPTTQKWWDIMMPMQQPVNTKQEGEWWSDMEEVFHSD